MIQPSLQFSRWRFAILAAMAVCFYGGAADKSAAKTYRSDLYKLKVTTVADGLKDPWSLAFLPDGRMLVTEKPGRLRYVSANGNLSAPIRGLPKIAAGGQGGLLNVVLDPDFANNQTIYFSYSEPGATPRGRRGRGTAVARARLEQDRLTDLKVIFRQYPKAGTLVHFGSRLVIDRQGYLFITLGDRGQRRRAQDTSVNRGQVVRIHRDGRIPDDNPFAGQPGKRPEIWSYGHRNPQGAALHPLTGKLWIHEHGARGGDEINIPQAGRNYGWPIISYGRHYSGARIGVGTHKKGMQQPIYYWDPSIAPSGMSFYTGDKFPKWKGSLLIGALKYKCVARLTLQGDKVVGEERILQHLRARIRDVRQGPDGYIYLLTHTRNGKILRVEPAGR